MTDRIRLCLFVPGLALLGGLLLWGLASLPGFGAIPALTAT